MLATALGVAGISGVMGVSIGALGGDNGRPGMSETQGWSAVVADHVKRPFSLIPISAVIGAAPIAQAAPAPVEVPDAVLIFDHPDWAHEMLNAINALRQDAGLGSVELCATLGYAATQYAETMATHQWLKHEGPDGSRPIDRVRAAGYAGHNVSENIATGFSTAAATLRAFMVSASHRATILGADHRFAGFGTADGYWTQYFGSGPTC
jgi:uncharacterized protein YkwD